MLWNCSPQIKGKHLLPDFEIVIVGLMKERPAWDKLKIINPITRSGELTVA